MSIEMEKLWQFKSTQSDHEEEYFCVCQITRSLEACWMTGALAAKHCPLVVIIFLAVFLITVVLFGLVAFKPDYNGSKQVLI